MWVEYTRERGDFKGDAARRGVASRPLIRFGLALRWLRVHEPRRRHRRLRSIAAGSVVLVVVRDGLAGGPVPVLRGGARGWGGSGGVRRGARRWTGAPARRPAIFFARRARDRLARGGWGEADVTRGVEAYLPRGARDETKTQTDGNLGAHVNLGGCGVRESGAREEVSVARPRSSVARFGGGGRRRGKLNRVSGERLPERVPTDGSSRARAKRVRTVAEVLNRAHDARVARRACVEVPRHTGEK